MEYVKDNGEYNKPRDFRGTFGRNDQTTLDLINTCKYVFKDKRGEYVYDASHFNEEGKVIFVRRYTDQLCKHCGASAANHWNEGVQVYPIVNGKTCAGLI